MKEVIVQPERCVGCMQCMLACATAHSKAKQLFAATLETPLPMPRIHVGSSRYGDGFPNRCRHCNPAPCMAACLPGAIFRETETQTVLINPDRCINCASCAMACPFGVIRYAQEAFAPSEKTIALKCDNCIQRQDQGLIPACVEACKTDALIFDTPSEAMKRKSHQVAELMTSQGDGSQMGLPVTITILKQHKHARHSLHQET